MIYTILDLNIFQCFISIESLLKESNYGDLVFFFLYFEYS